MKPHACPAREALTEQGVSLVSGTRAMRRLDELANASEEIGRLTRLYLTPAHKAAALQVKVWMEDAGLKTYIDAVGNVVGRYAGTHDDEPVLLIGSHIDTVRNAGKYDGCLGVIVAIEAIAELHARGERMPFAIEVIAFGDEEGVRFPVTLTGSKAISGTLDPKALRMVDAGGISIRDALKDFGCRFDPQSVARERRNVRAYLEIHIEQGPILESMKLPVGVVTAIAGASRAKITVKGTAGHAGTVPMKLRRDAGAAAAEMSLAVERQAVMTDNLVATVGTFHTRPGAANVIPGEADFSIDLRSPFNKLRSKVLASLRSEFTEIAARRRVEMEMTTTYDQVAATCDPDLIALWEDAIKRVGIVPFRLASGAGHDGLAMMALCPISMLFVRCRGGISHNPAEAVEEKDVQIAITTLIEMIRLMGHSQSRHTRPNGAKVS